MKYMLQTVAALLVLVTATYAQTRTLNGVYAGIRVTPAVVMGGGMNREDIVIYFRPDGTYTYDLHKPDWQTLTDGRYTINGKAITLTQANNKRTTNYKLDDDGDIDAGGCTLLKQHIDGSVPKGYYEFNKISSSGGGSSGMVYVGSSQNKGLYFDGAGNFSSKSASATVVSGEGIGGGSSRDNTGKGTYTINKGVLTLKYDNGKTVVHSFFCRPGDPVIAVVDGNLYFMEDEKKKATAAAKKRADKTTTTTAPATGEPADGKTLLLKANAVLGGTRLDQLKTMGFTATLQGLQAQSFVDVAAKRVRLEVRQAGKLVQVEQLENGTGWQWKQGKTGALPAVRVSEMGAAFYGGLLGLRKQEIEAATLKEVKNSSAGYTIHTQREGKQYLYLLNPQSQVLAVGDNAGQTVSTSVYSDWRTVQGVLLPFKEVSSAGNRKVTILYQQYELDVAYPASVWSKPGE